MAIIPTNWTATEYTVDDWTPLVSGTKSTVTTIIAANCSSTEQATISIRIADLSGTVNLCKIIPIHVLEPLDSITLDVRSVNVLGDQQIQFCANVVGVEVMASGVSYVDV